MPRNATDARDRILNTADTLFYQQGIRAIGVDTIIARSEVAKTTFYRYFPAKDDLVIAYLEDRDRRFWELFEEAVSQSAGNPQQQLIAIFDWLAKLIATEENQGCPFLIVASEFPDSDYPGHRVAIAHKTKMRDRLTELATASGINQAEELSAGLMLLVDGAFVQRRLDRSRQIDLHQVATRLIRAYE
ncbi:TetR/AcrR family transcriptional regulator [Chamaesiphon minutus]|uniref:Transcriptional regulator n=1 Tax=Chamaesiphon minutus (strain ATCC 27169 / PCC 6605) TaxID=1173020 RepID=K9UQG8_CHAP6|nr:TetR/AcrR family transcriptional regulator [Chamaesiphon minutus]AFY96479.1 transcriptional regulator [Chamaesiphon minutus PCC 6605]